MPEQVTLAHDLTDVQSVLITTTDGKSVLITRGQPTIVAADWKRGVKMTVERLTVPHVDPHGDENDNDMS